MMDIIIRWDWIWFALRVVFIMFCIGKIWEWGKKSAYSYHIDDHMFDGAVLVKAFTKINGVMVKSCDIVDIEKCHVCPHHKDECLRYKRMMPKDDWPRA